MIMHTGCLLKKVLSWFLSYFCSRSQILPFHMCFEIRILRPFHLATQIISIQNINCPKNAETHAHTWFLSYLLEVKHEIKLQILSRSNALGCFWFPKNLVSFQWKQKTLDMDVIVQCISHSWRKIEYLWKSIPHSWKSIPIIMSAHTLFAFSRAF